MQNRVLSAAFSILINCYVSIINCAISFLLEFDSMVNVHRVVVSAQPQGDDRCRRRGDDGRDGRIVVPVVVAVDADRLPAPEDARTAKQDGVRDRVLDGSARRYFVDHGTVLLLHLDRRRARLEDHPAMPRRRFSRVLGRETRFVSPDRLILGVGGRVMFRATCCYSIIVSVRGEITRISVSLHK